MASIPLQNNGFSSSDRCVAIVYEALNGVNDK